MNIAVDASALIINRFSGLAEVVRSLTRNLSLLPENQNITLYLNYFRNGVPDSEIDFPYKNIRCLRLPRHIVDWWWECDWPQFDCYIKNIDLFHSLHINLPPLKKTKSVLTVHDCRYMALPKLYGKRAVERYRRKMEKSLGRVDHVTTVSNFTKCELIEYFAFPEDRITFISNGFSSNHVTTGINKDEIDCFLKRNRLPSEYLLFTGGLDPRKNLNRLIEAMRQCKSEMKDFPDLILTGLSKKQWTKSRQAKKAIRHGIYGNIFIAGMVEKNLLKTLTRNALALCYPSLYEGFGFPPLEAMSCGVPVLAGRSSAIPEVTGDAACLVDPLCEADIALGLYRLISDADYRRKLVERGFFRVKKFSWQQAAAHYNRLYKRILGK
jgi:glycosyltransferase involved in cell wall biosynthesis